RRKCLLKHARRDLGDLAALEPVELEGTERDADEAVHLESEDVAHAADLPVLAFAEREAHPHVRTLPALDFGSDRPVADALDGDAPLQRRQPLRLDLAVGAYAVPAEESRRGKLELALDGAVVGEEEKPFAGEVEAPDRQ